MSRLRWKMHPLGGMGSVINGRFGEYRIAASPFADGKQALWRKAVSGVYELLSANYATPQEAVAYAEADSLTRSGGKA